MARKMAQHPLLRGLDKRALAELGARAMFRSFARGEMKGWDETNETPDRAEAEQAVRTLAELSEGDRDVLLLTSWAGLDSTEVADALGIPVGTVRSRLHRGRRMLQKALWRVAQERGIVPAGT